MSVVSTPEERFDDVPDYDYQPRYVDVADAVPADVASLEMAYVEAGDPEAGETFLLLHGEPTWGYLYRHVVPGLAERGRVVVPDAIGFGRSDKFTDRDAYSFDLHYRALGAFLESLDLTDVTLVAQDWGGIIGLSYAAHQPDRFARLVAMNTDVPTGDQEMTDAWEQFHGFVERVDELPIGMLIQNATARELSPAELAAYEAPFPDEAAKAGAYAWPDMVPRAGGGDGHEQVRAARERLAEWTDPAFVLFADADPITRPARDDLRELVPSASEQPDVWVEGAMHFLQEDAGEEIAEEIVAFVDRTEN